MKKHVFASLVLGLGIAASAQAASVSYLVTANQGRGFTYVNGDMELHYPNNGVGNMGAMNAIITIDLDPSTITQSSPWSGTNVYSFSNVSMTAYFANGPFEAFPVTFNNITATLTDNVMYWDTFYFYGQKQVTRNGIDYTAAVHFDAIGNNMSGYMATPLTPDLRNFTNLLYDGNFGFDAFTSPGFGWSVDNKINFPTIALAPVPIPGAAWLFGSALVLPLASAARRSCKA